MSWKLNPFTGGYQYSSDESAEESLSANRLEINKIATGPVGYLQLVTLISTTNVSISGVDSRENATVFGLALNSAIDGEVVRILLFGHYDDPLLTFGLNESLFQDMNGDLTTVATTIVGENWARVGRSYGDGSVFISPESPVEVQ